MHWYRTHFFNKKKAATENKSGGRKRKYSRVDLQASCLTAAIVVVACYLVFFMNYYFSYTSMIGDLQDRALNIHAYLENRLDRNTFYSLDGVEDESTETYAQAREILERTKGVTGVRYLYTAKRMDNGSFIYLVDGLNENSPDFRHVGDPIEPECLPDMERALSGEVVLPEKISKTTWGPVFITYFPMHQEDEIIGVMGMEFDAGRQYVNFRRMIILTPVVIIFFCFVASFIALKWFRRISNPSYQDLATMDFLTGLRNRNSFEVDLENLEARKKREGVALISVDLDDLKSVNDTLGHAAGDEYITTGARIIGEGVSLPDILYRIGGDEFCIIAKKKTQEEIEAFIEEAGKKAAQEENHHAFHIGLSMGYALFDGQVDKSLFDTLKRADAQMYLHKKKRKAARN